MRHGSLITPYVFHHGLNDGADRDISEDFSQGNDVAQAASKERVLVTSETKLRSVGGNTTILL